MFGVLCFSLGVRMSLSVGGAGHMPRRCAARRIIRRPPVKKRNNNKNATRKTTFGRQLPAKNRDSTETSRLGNSTGIRNLLYGRHWKFQCLHSLDCMMRANQPFNLKCSDFITSWLKQHLQIRPYTLGLGQPNTTRRKSKQSFSTFPLPSITPRSCTTRRKMQVGQHTNLATLLSPAPCLFSPRTASSATHSFNLVAIAPPLFFPQQMGLKHVSSVT